MRLRLSALSWTSSTVVGVTALLLSSLPQTAYAQTITGFEGFARPNNGNVMFRQPSFSGSTLDFLDTSNPAFNQSIITNTRANTGTQSMQVNFQFKAAQNNPFLRLSTFNAVNLPNPAIDLSLAVQFALYVPASTPDFYLTLGVRETGVVTTIGGNGGTTGAIELVGATASQGSSPIGKLITTKDTWLNIVFNLPNEPVRGFAGAANGVLNGTFGTIEGLYITPTSNANVGPYTFFLDDFRQTPLVSAAAPEPSSVLLALVGLTGFCIRRRKARRVS
jgi:hypothetical protein